MNNNIQEKYNIIVLGDTGMLGHTLKKYLINRGWSVHGVNRQHFNVLSPHKVSIDMVLFQRMEKQKINVVINCIGAIPQRNVSDRDMIQINALFPHTLYDCKILNFPEYDIEIINITTDCVFSGNRSRYIESDIHDAIDIYGKTKSLGENSQITNIRTSIIGEEFRDNKVSLLEWARKNKGGEIKGYVNHFWNGVTTLQLSKYIEYIIRDNKFWVGKNTAKHYFSKEIYSKYRLLQIINDVYNLGMTITPQYHEKSIDRSLTSVSELIQAPDILSQLYELRNFF